MENGKSSRTSNFWAITPILIFIVLFLGSGIMCAQLGYEKPFSQFPACLGAYIALLASFFILKGSFSEKFQWMLNGIARPNIAIPIIVMALAGAFVAVADACGGVDSVVGLCLNYMPTSVVTAGFFVIGCIVSFASGSTISTVAALAPIALSVAAGAGISLPVMVGSVMGSAMFGNSMSPISDCTIVSNSVMGLGAAKGPKDKLLSQIKIYAIPFAVTLVFLLLFGRPNSQVTLETYEVNFAAILPYVAILTLAFMGINFVISLSGGIFLGLFIGIAQGQFTVLEGCQTVASGMYNMANMILLFIFMAGNIGMISQAGGVDWAVDQLTRFIRGKRSAEIVIMLACMLVTGFVANDTIPMVTLGDIIRDICRKYKIDPRRAACLIPIATASTAVMIPYTPPCLIIAGLIEESGYDTSFIYSIPCNVFVLLVLVMAVVTVFVPFSSRHFAKNPWNFEKEALQSDLAAQ